MDKQDFSKMMTLVNKSLASVLLTYYIHPKKNIEIIPTETDGWEVNLKYIPNLNCHLEIWFDRWAAYDDRKLWYGFFSKQKNNILYLSKRYAKSCTKPFTINDEDVDYNTHKYKLRLKSKLSKKLFEVPVLEFYLKEGYYFYGMYEFSPIPKSNLERNRLVERIANFYDTILKSSDIKRKESKSEDYSRFENRKKVVSHIQRERNTFLSTLRKQKDNYKCFVCGFRYQDKYGKIGKDYAEAHHIIPLSNLKSQTKTNVEDLITVCANCHRILHRMNGNQTDIVILKKIISSKNN